MTNTTFEDIHSDIIQTHILPLLDGPSLSNTSYVSNNLQSICSDHHLWFRISKSTWPSIIDPRVDDVISSFPARHRSFYDDSYPSLVTDVSRDGTMTQSDQVYFRKSIQNEEHNFFQPGAFKKIRDFLQKLTLHHKTLVPSPVTNVSHLNLPYSTSKKEIISAVDIRYENDIIYSAVKVTDTSSADFLSSGLKIELPGVSRTIDLTVDEIAGADKATLLHLKESLTLNWILIDPALKRAGNFSSIKPVSAKQDWATNETHIRYVTILPGRDDSNEIVKCRIHLALGVGKGGIGLHVKEVMLKLEDLHCNCLNGRDFLVTMQGAIMEENYVTRKVVAEDEENLKSYKVFKELKKMKKELVKQKQHKREVVINLSYGSMLLCYFISLYFAILLLRQ